MTRLATLLALYARPAILAEVTQLAALVALHLDRLVLALALTLGLAALGGRARSPR